MVLLTFDIEEFDYPEELGLTISEERKMQVSSEGLRKILKVLADNQVRATFFCTAYFAERAQELMAEIVAGGHEIASHGYNHSSFEKADLLKSRLRLQEIIGQPVIGYRMARMQHVEPADIAQAGYLYDSSLNPLYIPGRYNNFDKPRSLFKVLSNPDLYEFPASVSPIFRLPLFWLALHHYPFCLYKYLAKRVLKKDGYLITYFHPWEFADIKHLPEGKLSYVATHHSGDFELHRLEKFIHYFKEKGESFAPVKDFLKYEKNINTDPLL